MGNKLKVNSKPEVGLYLVVECISWSKNKDIKEDRTLGRIALQPTDTSSSDNCITEIIDGCIVMGELNEKVLNNFSLGERYAITVSPIAKKDNI